MEPDLIPYTPMKEIGARCALVLAPHADDEVFGCGGAIANHIRNGVPVHVAILTDGALYADPQVRQEESRHAARMLGYGQPEFWGFADRGLSCNEPLISRIVHAIAQYGADLVYAPSHWEVHPDHRQAHRAAVEALLLSPPTVRLAFYEVGSPLRPNVLLDISELQDLKFEAMQCFASQLKQQDYSKHIQALNQYRTYTLGPQVRAAEAYWVLTQQELCEERWNGTLHRASPGNMLRESPSLTDLPLVEIIVISTNGAHLQEALDSIALQTYPQIEVSVLACRPQGQPIPHLRCGSFRLNQQFVAGHALFPASINECMAARQGPYLMLIDENDSILPNHVSRLLFFLKNQPAARAASTSALVVNEEGFPNGIVLDDTGECESSEDQPVAIHSVLMKSDLRHEGCQFDDNWGIRGCRRFLKMIHTTTVIVQTEGRTAIFRERSSLADSHVHAGSVSNFLNTTIAQQPQKWLGKWMSRLVSLFK